VTSILQYPSDDSSCICADCSSVTDVSASFLDTSIDRFSPEFLIRHCRPRKELEAENLSLRRQLDTHRCCLSQEVTSAEMDRLRDQNAELQSHLVAFEVGQQLLQATTVLEFV
jgi:hypothetical protein